MSYYSSLSETACCRPHRAAHFFPSKFDSRPGRMLSALRAAPPTPASEPKTKFKSVLGFAASGTPKDIDALPSFTGNDHGNGRSSQLYTRRSVDTINSYQAKRQNKSGRPSVVEALSFEDDAVTVAQATDIPVSMKNGIAPRSMPSRRIPQRGDKQEGPWTISVAETPHDATSYSLYVKSESCSLCTCCRWTSGSALVCHDS